MLKKTFFLGLLAFVSFSLQAKIKLPTILADNMVLQQKSDVKIWGNATPNKQITVIPSWDKKSYTTSSNQEGKWLLTVRTPEAGGPYEISISDGDELKLKDILIGEVWFCSGQSNMQMPLRGYSGQPIKGANDVIAKAKESTPIRMYMTENRSSKTPMDDVDGKWTKHNSADVSRWSATAYYFGRYLQETLEVPVGLVVSAWGGSKIEAWMSEESLEPFKQFDLSHLTNDAPLTTREHQTPCYLFNAKLHPLLNFTIKGFLWYQGESNREIPDLYAKLQTAFVKDLRNRWGVGQFPFYYVQIAPFAYNEPDGISSVKIREAQLQCMKEIPNSGMAVTLDLGEENCIHPSRKEEVGNRLAYWALAKAYGKKGFEYCSPVYKDIEIKDGKIFVSFNKTVSKSLSPVNVELKNFEIAGDDKVFYPAKATIDAKKGIIEVSSDKTPNPVAVRYGYKNYVDGSVFDDFGLPISSFRSDDWE